MIVLLLAKVAVAQSRQFVGKIEETFRDHMDDEADALQTSTHGKKARRHHRAAIAVKDLGPDNDIGNVRFVFERHEHDTFRRARPLPHQDQAGHGDR
jgi:hypothetical protein